MTRRFAWLWTALIALTGATYQYLVHSALVGGQDETMRVALAFVPLLGLACWVVARARHKFYWALALLAIAIVIYVLETRAPWGLAAAYGLPHAAIYLSLLLLFGSTLRPGREPLVTRLARTVHGTLAPAMAAYARNVTIAWCVFFCAQVAASALLFCLAPPAVWSLFINVVNMPLLILMFAGEYAYRSVRHREFPHASFFDGIRAFTRDAAHDGGAGCASPRA
ncbi:MAG: hypothetical protein ABIS45_05535 [Burkholderiales bacterium]